ncbi:hypothetical protein [Leuconostoc gasicomitatum]|uniref:hypothetical protein n=1 Tax=Leuconostoc gasicomitatum TaxID=115778 RepID=UPI0007E201D8|nr:hypothetical protein [Leuconostoc gasicomitatum]CUW08495.1 hypothetical protein PB1E_0952 [Leuconostoc gasicomitatum]
MNKIIKDEVEKIEISDISSKLGIFGEIPTTVEMTYYTYEIPTSEFYNQLFNQVIALRVTSQVKNTDTFVKTSLLRNADSNLLFPTVHP